MNSEEISLKQFYEESKYYTSYCYHTYNQGGQCYDSLILRWENYDRCDIEDDFSQSIILMSPSAHLKIKYVDKIVKSKTNKQCKYRIFSSSPLCDLVKEIVIIAT
jgi:hypothetical protein